MAVCLFLRLVKSTSGGLNMFVKCCGIDIHYTVEGQGPDVLLLHGWGASLESYKGVINALEDKCRLIALDFPGCGESQLPEQPLDINNYVAIVMEFCSALEIRDPILIGHSHGGRVIMKLAGSGLMNPKKIVFIDAAGIKPRFDFKKTVKIKTFKTIKWALTLPVIRNYTGELLDKARGHFGSADYNSAPEVMRKTLVNLVNDDMTAYLDGIKASTLLIWGENDTATPLYMAKKIESIIPDCGLCVIKNTGHWSFVEKPHEAQAILRSFLP